MSTSYRDDLAYIHDVGFGYFATESAPGLLALLRRSGIHGGLVVDLGCGSGLWARELVRAGYEVLGVDLSGAMVELAKKRVPEATFRRGSFLKAKLPPCQAITAIGECFNYLSDEEVGMRRLAGLFARAQDALAPGGLLIFDVAEPGRNEALRKRSAHREGRDWAILFEVEEDARKRTLVRRMTTFRRVGKLYRRQEEVHRLRLYRASEVLAALRDVGFKVRTLRAYGKRKLFPGHVAFVARKG